MPLRQSNSCYDPKDLERVLPVLDRRLYDRGDGGVVFHAGLRAEASADLEFGLGRPERLLAVVVRGRDGRVGEEGEDVVPVLGNALFEFVQYGHLAACNLLPDHLIWSLRELPHGIQHVGDGALADVKPEDGLIQVREPFERDVLVGAEIRSHGHDVGTVGHRRVHAFRKTSLAAAPACALDLHLKMVHDRCHNRERDVHHLPRGGDCRSLHVQRPAALRTHGSVSSSVSGAVPRTL